MIQRLSSWQLSLLIHLSVAVFGVLMVYVPVPQPELVDVPIYVPEAPVPTQVLRPEKKAPVVLKSVNAPAESKAPARAVFGASRNSLTSSEGVAEVKRGNTVAKSVDAEILTADDPDSLPTPTDEFLVSQMPVVISEVRPVYPKEARDARTEGAVVVDALIDATGRVRQVQVIEGLPVFRQPALEALKKFLFKPALVDGKAVAVRIRYTLRFRLE